jgi:hypothetical protein
MLRFRERKISCGILFDWNEHAELQVCVCVGGGSASGVGHSFSEIGHYCFIPVTRWREEFLERGGRGQIRVWTSTSQDQMYVFEVRVARLKHRVLGFDLRLHTPMSHRPDLAFVSFRWLNCHTCRVEESGCKIPTSALRQSLR